MKLFVGLGNYGKEYENTRHNMGFITIDKFADMAGVDFDRNEFKGVYTIIKNPVFPEPIIIAKPMTYMNLSGTFVQPLAAYFKIDIEDIVIIYDDMALPEGTIRLRLSGSSGGQKGMQNIIDLLGKDEIKRIRVGIGEPEFHNAIDYVLSKPTGESLTKIDDATTKAAEALKEIAIHGFTKAMNKYNQK
ncbi:MAG: aminoacyl-tRNA hydrolase [Bacilli bacterium]|nr:aminoacyl-tRNA hydrolase [Bacilli bacterium]